MNLTEERHHELPRAGCSSPWRAAQLARWGGLLALCATSLDGYGHKTEHKNGKGNAGDDLAVATQGGVLVEHHGLPPAA